MALNQNIINAFKKDNRIYYWSRDSRKYEINFRNIISANIVKLDYAEKRKKILSLKN